LKLKIAFLTDSRRSPLYQPGLVERLASAFQNRGADTAVIDLALPPNENTISLVKLVDALYPLPVVPSEVFSYHILFTEATPWLVNPISVQLTSLDKRRTIRGLQRSGLAYPETIDTPHGPEVVDFVRRHSLAIIKAADQVAGLGHYVVEADGDQLYAWIPNVARHRQLGTSDAHAHLPGSRVPLHLCDEGPFPVQPGRLPTASSGARSVVVHGPYLVQQLVGSRLPARMRDRVYRLYVVGGRALFGSARIMRHQPPGDLSYAIVNYSWGGDYEMIPRENLPESLIDLGLATIQALKIEVGAVDLIEGEAGQWLALEAETDNFVYHICRAFRQARNYTDAFDLDDAIAEWVTDRLNKGDAAPSLPATDAEKKALIQLLVGN
jgi:hypothetical protein